MGLSSLSRRFSSLLSPGEPSRVPRDASPQRTIPRDASPPRTIPPTEFELVEKQYKLDEEAFSWYSAKTFYPVRIGEVFQDRYQVLVKIGFGTASTSWMCRDLWAHRHVALKVYASNQAQNQREIAALRHIDAVISERLPIQHVGVRCIRRLRDSFELSRGRRRNLCLVYDMMGSTLADLKEAGFDGRMPVDIVKAFVFYIVRALDFLHRKANLVHGDIQEDNIMLDIGEDAESLLQELEKAERDDPSPRKVYKDHTIYLTREFHLPGEVSVLCDFGEARFGEEWYAEHAMPDLHRAPEILLGLRWDEKIDIWALGLTMWSLVEGRNLFVDNKGGRFRSARAHMARTISLFGPPPQHMLDITKATSYFFDKRGQLKGGHKIIETSLEEETVLEGDDKKEFLRFLRRLLQWDPEKRPSARELLKDPWLRPPEEGGEQGAEPAS